MKRIIALATAGLLLWSAQFPEAFAQAVDPADLRPAIVAQERNNQSLLARAGVVGTAVGVDAQRRPVVKVYTDGPGVRGLPGSVDGIPVRVEVIGRIVALQGPGPCTGPPRNRPPECNGGGNGGEDETPPDEEVDNTDPTSWFLRPVPIGVSTGHPDITAGTICCRVKDSRNVYALSNNHVYANSNQAYNGDNVLQPGPYDGGKNPGDKIGTLHDFVPIMFSTSASNRVDAAIARTADLGNATPSNGYGAPRSTPVAPAVGMNVMKYGRSTGLTTGRVDAINATVLVSYGDAGTARFVGQIVLRPGGFSRGGDSGSLVVVRGGANDRSPVGLLFAGSNSVTIANPIGDVLDVFGITIDGDP